MMRQLSILAIALLCTFSVSAQHLRRVLVEEFTNASCGPCAAANPGFNATIDANLQYITPIKWQTNWPGVDPMNAQTQTDVAPRVSYYGVTGVPNGRQGGSVEVFPLSNLTSASIAAEYNNLTPVTITAAHHFNATFDSVFINVAVTSDVALTGTLRLRTVVVEDNIFFNAPPGSNGETGFFQIMRKTLPNTDGTNTGNFTAGETKSYSFKWKLANFYDLNQLSVAAFLQNDATKEVFQSVRSEPLTPGIPGLGATVPNENIFACASGFSPSFTINNNGNGTLTNALLRYRKLPATTWTDLNWTGSLAAGASEDVQLTDIVITAAGTVSIEVAVISSNLGIQTYLVGGTSTIKVLAAIDPASALPFANTFQSAAFPPTGWSSINAGANGWKLATNAGSGSSRSARCNMYDIPKGSDTYLHTPKLDLTAATGTSTLTFDHAYAPYSTVDYDGLRVEVSTDCGQTWSQVFYLENLDLATAPAITTAFVPVAGQWAPNEVDITPFNGHEILIRFTGVSGYGNNLFVDNVNVTSTVGTKELTLSVFNLVPNPTRDFAEVRFGLETAQNIELRVYSAEGALVQSQLLGELPSGENRVVMNATKLATGSYRVVLQSKEGVAQTQWIVVK